MDLITAPPDFRELGCRECQDGTALGFELSMAFQPVVDVNTKTVFAHEALVRGAEQQSAGWVFSQINDSNRYRFDQACRVKAISLASQLDLPGLLSINFMPNAVYRPELCIRTTLKAADEFQFPISRIMFEVTEVERIEDHEHLRGIMKHYQNRGFVTAIDDFGAGYSGLKLLTEFDADIIKLDMALVQGISADPTRRAIVGGIVQVCADLGKKIIAEGVEQQADLACLRDLGIGLFQGYYFARPGFECLPEIANLEHC